MRAAIIVTTRKEGDENQPITNIIMTKTRCAFFKQLKIKSKWRPRKSILNN